MLVLKFLPTLITDGPPQLWMAAAFGPLLISFLLLFWWLLASRASWAERLLGFAGAIGLIAGTIAVSHPTMIGPPNLMLTIPIGMVGFAFGAIIAGNMVTRNRAIIALLIALIGFAYTATLRNVGMWGGFEPIVEYRWNPSAEDLLLVKKAEGSSSDAPKLELTEAQIESLNNPLWAGFRGNDRNGVQQGTEFSLDWDSQPPEEVWRIGVGPGWGAFVVAGDFLFTQEQRGEYECVVCYDAKNGKEIWESKNETRFYEALGGPGPRTTPTLFDGSLYAAGAAGHLSRINAATGQLVWKIDVKELSNSNAPMWGFSSSPIVVGDTVVTYVGGNGKYGTVAFDIADGSFRWGVPAGKMSYSSPQVVSLHGKSYIAMGTNLGLDFISPESGDIVTTYEWKVSGYRSLQPYVVDDETILLPTGLGAGTRKVKFSADLKGEEVWTSMRLKPDFNDIVVKGEFIYGFDQKIFTCIDLKTGKRQWKGGRYGKGQAILLNDSAAILVITETGELALVATDGDEFRELGKLKVFEGKTWNHPVVVGDRLYIRNDEEAACYRLPVE